MDSNHQRMNGSKMKLGGRIVLALTVTLVLAGCNQTQQSRSYYGNNAQIAQWEAEAAGMDEKSRSAYLANRVSSILPNQRLNACATGPRR